MKIVEYNGEEEILLEQMIALQDYLVQIDPMKQLIRTPDYGPHYVNFTLQRVAENNGKIYFAKYGDNYIGCIAGIILQQSPHDLRENIVKKEGRVIEIFVVSNFRGHEIGTRLMHTMEKYFKNKGCEYMRVEVLADNELAQRLYRSNGFQNRMIDMMKEI